MIKKILLSSAGLILVSGFSASAADMPRQQAPVLVAAPVSSWTGFYVGVGAGGAASTFGVRALAEDVQGSFHGVGSQSALFGINLGADYQFAPQYVVGAFFDYDWHNGKVSASASFNDGEDYAYAGARAKIKSQWALGARLGYLTSPTTLWYLSGGYTSLNVGNLTGTASWGEDGGSMLIRIPDFTGWFVGLGAESMLTKNVSIKAEYRYASYQGKSLGLPYDWSDYVNIRVEPQVQTFKASINYRFNSW